VLCALSANIQIVADRDVGPSYHTLCGSTRIQETEQLVLPVIGELSTHRAVSFESARDFEQHDISACDRATKVV
jgi:hypothetical protein